MFALARRLAPSLAATFPAASMANAATLADGRVVVRAAPADPASRDLAVVDLRSGSSITRRAALPDASCSLAPWGDSVAAACPQAPGGPAIFRSRDGERFERVAALPAGAAHSIAWSVDGRSVAWRCDGRDPDTWCGLDAETGWQPVHRSLETSFDPVLSGDWMAAVAAAPWR